MGVVAEVIAPEHSVNGIVLTLVRSDWKSCLWRVGGGDQKALLLLLPQEPS